MSAEESILQEEACRPESPPLALQDGSLALQAFPQADAGPSLPELLAVEELPAAALLPLVEWGCPEASCCLCLLFWPSCSAFLTFVKLIIYKAKDC